MEISKLLSRYPKVRTPLPEPYQKIYETHYSDNRNQKTTATKASGFLEKWLHVKVAEDVKPGHSLKTLEIGAGSLNHLPYEMPTGVYDVVEPFKLLYEGTAHQSMVRNYFNDLSEVKDSDYDRIASIASFEHILDLPTVIAKSALLLKPSGSLRVSIPSEGELMWKLGYTLTTGIEFWLKHKLDYSLLMKYEHVNKSKEIETLLRYFFTDVRKSLFGISNSLSFYQFFECKNADVKKAKDYLLAAAD